jgi:hypothetical protein
MAASSESALDTHHLIASDRVEGTPVRGLDGAKLGEIQRVMIDKVSGKVAYAVLRFGGFFGLGGRHHAVPWDKLKYEPGLGAYHLDMAEAELESAAEHDEATQLDWGERARHRDRVPPRLLGDVSRPPQSSWPGACPRT